MTGTRPQMDIEARLAEVLAIHFDPNSGTPYWLDRAKAWGFDPRGTIRTVSDLARLGRMEPHDLREHPWEHFVPRSVLSDRRKLILAQTGGTLGRPSWTAYLEEEFDEAFVEPFVAAARHVGFPEGGAWLYVGPTGSHIIGRAADAIARRTGSTTPFTVDFDARWIRKLPPDSFAAQRYLSHVVEQAIDAIDSQAITILFTTPPVLKRLADRMSSAQRDRIQGVHYGGLALNPADLEAFQRRWFPKAVHLSGYGNTLFGCCLELTADAGRTPRYFPHAARLLFGVWDPSSRGRVGAAHHTLPRYDDAAARGRIVFSRLDRTMLLLNVLERDVGRLVEPPPDAPAGFFRLGVESPAPQVRADVPPGMAIY